MTFIVVEDDDLDFKQIKRVFSKLAIRNPIERAHDGLEALDLLKGQNGRRKAQLPYTILLDINMPRMNGFQFLGSIRKDPELHRDIVFVVSSSDAERDMEEAQRLQVAGFLQKDKFETSFQEAVIMIQHYWKSLERPV